MQTHRQSSFRVFSWLTSYVFSAPQLCCLVYVTSYKQSLELEKALSDTWLNKQSVTSLNFMNARTVNARIVNARTVNTR